MSTLVQKDENIIFHLGTDTFINIKQPVQAATGVIVPQKFSYKHFKQEIKDWKD